MSFASRTSVGVPPSGASTASATLSASGGITSDSDVSRASPGLTCSNARPYSESVGLTSTPSLDASSTDVAASPAGSVASTALTPPVPVVSGAAVASPATTTAGSSCEASSENPPMPRSGRIAAIVTRFPREPVTRLPSGLSAGITDFSSTRSTRVSPTDAARSRASDRLTATASAVSGGDPSGNPSFSRPSAASSVARAARRPFPEVSTARGMTTAGTSRSGGSPAASASLAAREASKNRPAVTAAETAPSRCRPRASRFLAIESPTPNAPPITAARTAQAAASGSTLLHQPAASRRQSAASDRLGVFVGTVMPFTRS